MDLAVGRGWWHAVLRHKIQHNDIVHFMWIVCLFLSLVGLISFMVLEIAWLSIYLVFSLTLPRRIPTHMRSVLIHEIRFEIDTPCVSIQFRHYFWIPKKILKFATTKRQISPFWPRQTGVNAHGCKNHPKL